MFCLGWNAPMKQMERHHLGKVWLLSPAASRNPKHVGFHDVADAKSANRPARKEGMDPYNNPITHYNSFHSFLPS